MFRASSWICKEKCCASYIYYIQVRKSKLHCEEFTTLRSFDHLIPDAPELIQNYLEGEQDPSCKRNAFMMLVHVDKV